MIRRKKLFGLSCYCDNHFLNLTFLLLLFTVLAIWDYLNRVGFYKLSNQYRVVEIINIYMSHKFQNNLLTNYQGISFRHWPVATIRPSQVFPMIMCVGKLPQGARIISYPAQAAFLEDRTSTHISIELASKCWCWSKKTELSISVFMLMLSCSDVIKTSSSWFATYSLTLVYWLFLPQADSVMPSTNVPVGLPVHYLCAEKTSVDSFYENHAQFTA